jgi:hypothetical protein
MNVYRIYTRVNAADTCRDLDDYHYTELCYKSSPEKAKEYIEEYVKEHFFKPEETRIYEDEDGFHATNFVSYGATIFAKKVEVQ